MKRLMASVLAHSDRELVKVCLEGAQILPGEITLSNGITINLPQYLREGCEAEIEYIDGVFLATSRSYMLYVALIAGMRKE